MKRKISKLNLKRKENRDKLHTAQLRVFKVKNLEHVIFKNVYLDATDTKENRNLWKFL